ncbi:MAG: asparagine synthase (glutamine-hydrolyzing) [Acidobacteria bacterium]|nr:MAG: asparagine synthase (glutamine-hydrolyzing) [Acidobacteriota bacterium]
MCGIAGIVDLQQQRRICPHALTRMARSLVHRGPDEEGFFIRPAFGLAARRLSIVGIADGQQPVFNESRSVVAVFNGELFDYPELRELLRQRGHALRSHSDSELLVHLWEDFGEDMFPHLRGQFAFALLDIPRHRLILGRDRVGICPLHWSRQGDWLVFASEIKALFASELVPRAPDPKGLDNVFTFFCMPGRRTAFQGINAVPPGHYLRIDFGTVEHSPTVQEKTYWDFSFPDRGQEESPSDPAGLTSAFDEAFGQAVRRRLRADVPVASYLSGGVDPSLVVAKCRQLNDAGLSTFTARVSDRRLDESALASGTASALGCANQTVYCDQQTLVDIYPQVIAAADCPVVDPNAGSLHALSRAVHDAGYKVVLSGEGADEAPDSGRGLASLSAGCMVH